MKKFASHLILVVSVIGTVGFMTACGSGADFTGKSAKKSNKPAPTTSAPTTEPVKQTTDRSIQFGVDKVFHIGDNNYADSSCKGEIDSYKLSGNRYYFEFDVTEPQTQLNIAVNKVCGVDYILTNTTRLTQNGTIIQVQPLLPSSGGIQYQGLTVGPGRYSLIVESTKNYNKVRSGDNDDFVVGNVMVTANKPISGGSVRTE